MIYKLGRDNFNAGCTKPEKKIDHSRLLTLVEEKPR